MSLKRRSSSPGSTNSLTASLELCELAVKWPTMWEFLSLTLWPDGKSRSTGTILFFVEQGRVKANLNDRDAGVSTFVSGTSLSQCLEAVEAGLSDDSLEWRERKDGPRSAGRNKS